MRAGRAALLHGIYAIVNEDERDPRKFVHAIVNAGVHIVQYRAKHGIDADHLRTLRELTYEHDALLIMNDDWRAAIVFDCDGVHLGPDDEGFKAPAELRPMLDQRLIGLSCGTVEEALAFGKDADYLGVGAVYATGSKSDAGEPIGIEGLARIAAATSRPVAAVGGITPDNVGEVRATGVAMAAVISALSAARNPGTAARALVEAWVASHA